jgi:hypothetical protein
MDQLKNDILRGQEVCLNQNGKTGVDLVGKSDLLKRQKVVRGRMERQVLIYSLIVTYSKGGRWSGAGRRDRC